MSADAKRETARMSTYVMEQASVGHLMTCVAFDSQF